MKTRYANTFLMAIAFLFISCSVHSQDFTVRPKPVLDAPYLQESAERMVAQKPVTAVGVAEGKVFAVVGGEVRRVSASGLTAASGAPAAVLRADHHEASGLVGHSPKMSALYKQIALVAPSDSTVLVTGESGVGKELVARAIHHNSTRTAAPFVSINCGALTEAEAVERSGLTVAELQSGSFVKILNNRQSL